MIIIQHKNYKNATKWHHLPTHDNKFGNYAKIIWHKNYTNATKLHHLPTHDKKFWNYAKIIRHKNHKKATKLHHLHDHPALSITNSHKITIQSQNFIISKSNYAINQIHLRNHLNSNYTHLTHKSWNSLFIPALHEVGGSFCRSLSSFRILLDAIPLTNLKTSKLHQIRSDLQDPTKNNQKNRKWKVQIPRTTQKHHNSKLKQDWENMEWRRSYLREEEKKFSFSL